jgi:hypothetical protein
MPRVTLLPRDERPAHTPVAETVARALAAARQDNLPAARQLIDALPEVGERARAGTEFIAAFANEAPAQAAALALSWRLSPFATSDIEIAARAWAAQAPDEALRWGLTLAEPAMAAAARRAIATELVRTGPAAAVEKIAAQPESPARQMTLGFAVAAWARHDADTAEAWVRGHGDDETRSRLLLSLGFELAQTNPQRAIAMADRVPAGRDRWLLLAASSQTWVAQDHAAAMAWANQLPAGEARDAALAGVTVGLGAGARRVAGVTGLRGTRGRGGVGGTAISPDVASPAFAAWLATQSQGMTREQTILEYVRQRANVEPLVIGQWIANLPGSISRDQAIDEYLATADPGTAAQWLQSLARSDRTNERLERTAEQWLRTNPDAAAAWLAQSSLPPDRKEWLLRQAGR